MFWLLAIFIWAPFARAQLNSTANSTTCDAPNIPGFTYQDDCKLICRAAHWTDIIIFFLGNYVAHAATVVAKPGQSALASLISIITALLFPGGGIRSGVDAIMSLAKWGETNLQTAARAGAICAVVEADLEPDGTTPGVRGHGGPPTTASEAKDAFEPTREGAVETAALRAKRNPVQIRATRIHGLCQLPEGYDLVVVPAAATFKDDEAPPAALPLPPWYRRCLAVLAAPFRTDPHPLTNLSCSYNVVKIIISLLQLLFAISTLYRTRGNQIARYGYAAFGLTTVPYAWMSLVNLLGNILCPQYDTMYLVRSEGLRHLEERLRRGTPEEQHQFRFAGTVGELTSEADDLLKSKYREAMSGATIALPFGDDHKEGRGAVWLVVLSRLFPQLGLASSGGRAALGFVLSFYVAAVPIAVVGGLSRFEPGESALYQRVWTMLWLLLGFSVGALLEPPTDYLEGRPVIGTKSKQNGPPRNLSILIEHVTNFYRIALPVVYGATAIGGYVVVAQMLKEFGVCSLNQFQA